MIERGHLKPIELRFNLEHPDELTVVTEVKEDGDDEDDADDLLDDEADSSEDELQKRFDRMTFVVATKKRAFSATFTATPSAPNSPKAPPRSP